MKMEPFISGTNISRVVNTVFLLIVCIFGFLLLAPFVIIKDTNSMIISSALVTLTFIVIIYASNHIDKKSKDLESKVNELEQLVEENAKIEDMISSFISMFIETKDIDGAIHRALERTTELCKAEGSYLVYFTDDHTHYISHRWKTKEYKREISYFEKHGFSGSHLISEKLKKNQCVFSPAKNKESNRFTKEDNVFASLLQCPFIAMPVESNDDIVASMLIENHSIDKINYKEYKQKLKMMSELISMALNHRRFLNDLELFRNLIDRSNDFIFMIDVESSSIIDVNETACYELGYTRDEILEMRSDEIRELFKESFWDKEFKEIVGDRYLDPEKILKRKDGSTLPVELNVTFSTQDGHNYVIAVVRDITKRKDVENILTKTKEVMELALEGADLGMWDWNLRTNEIMYNQRWSRMLGYAPESVEQDMRAWKELIHPDDLGNLNENIRMHLIGETDFLESEFRMKNSKGTWQWILARGKLTEWDSNNKPFRMTGTTMDINDRKKAEEELRHSNELKDLFTDIMRHDLLNPAGNVKGYSEILMERENDTGKSKIIRSMQKNVDKLINMIETAAMFAKLESVEELECHIMDIMDIVKDVIEQFDQQLLEKNMTLEIKAMGMYPAMLNPIIEEVFANFISNAIKYSPENTNIIIDIDDLNYEWKVKVIDFGEGVPDESKDLVFDRFKRVDKSGVKGSGLGLAIVKKIAELLGGTVGVEDNSYGKGSIFWFIIKKQIMEHDTMIQDETTTKHNKRKGAPLRMKH